MMALILCTTDKKINSTLRPNPLPMAGTDFPIFENVRYREPTSVHNPTFIIRPAENRAWHQFNYALLFDEWNGVETASIEWARYLWVNDITINTDGTITVACKTDVLADYKPEILDSTLFVTRSQSAYNAYLIDSAMPTQINDHILTVETDAIFSDSYTEGTYIVGLMNDDPQAVGIPHYYAMTYTQWTAFCTGMLNTVDWANIDSTVMNVELQKALINPMQYITSAMWLPCPVGTQTETLTNLPLGYWDIPISTGAKRITGVYTWRAFTITLPAHPEVTSSTSFLNFSPYSLFRLTLEPFGEITLPAWARGGSVLTGRVDIDPCTGDGILHLTVGDSIVGNFFAKVGVEMQIGQTSLNVASMVSTETFSEALSAGALAMFSPVGDLQSAVSGVASNITAAATAVQTGGSRGSIAAYQWKPYLTATFKNPSSTNYSDAMGRPLCQKKLLGDLSGYTLCAYGNADTTASPAEKTEISGFLTTGFYIE